MQKIRLFHRSFKNNGIWFAERILIYISGTRFLTLFRMDFLEAASRQKPPSPKNCHTNPAMIEFGTIIPYQKKIQKIYDCVPHPLNSAEVSIFSPEISRFYYIIIPNSFNSSWIFKDYFNKYGYNFDYVSKNGCASLLKIKLFWNKGYDVITSVHDVTNKILSCESNYIVDFVMCPKFGNSSISMRKVIITSIL